MHIMGAMSDTSSPDHLDAVTSMCRPQCRPMLDASAGPGLSTSLANNPFFETGTTPGKLMDCMCDGSPPLFVRFQGDNSSFSPSTLSNLPPKCDGVIEAGFVTFTVEASSSVSDAQVEAMKAGLASQLGIDDIHLIEATKTGSSVSFKILAPDGATATQGVATISTTLANPTQAEAMMGVPVTVTVTPTYQAIKSDSGDDDDGLPTGALIGIIAGGVVLLAVLVAGAVMMMKKPGGAQGGAQSKEMQGVGIPA
jgi:hypothetical protein